MVGGEENSDPEFPEVRKGGLDRLIRVYGYVMAAVYKWRKKTGAMGPVIINGAQLPNGKVFGYPSIQCLRAAELFLLEKAQKGLKTARMKTLNVDTALEEDVNGITRKLVVIGSRGRNQIQGMYGQVDLPVLAKEHKLSELYAQAAHETGHEGVIITLHRTRRRVWIIHGRALADSIKSRCTECRLKEKKCMEQKMGPLPDHRAQVGAMFQSVAIDLFGPVEYQQHVKKRQVGKGWGVVFVCTTTSALHVEFMDTYSTDSFLLALRRFMSVRGTPTGFQSDRGEQLVAAAKQVATRDFKEVVQWAGRKGIEWTLVPTGGQHFNGQAERMIGMIKKQLWQTFEGKKQTHEETLIVLVEAVQKINSRPLTRNPRPEGEPLCVQDLMLGRAKPGQAQVKFESGKKLTKRFENVQRTQQEFWKRWIEEVFPEKLRQSKWKQEKRDLKVGDVVLRKDETAAGQTYKYAKVIRVHTSTDGKVRAADIEYKLPGESVFRTTTRPIHKLVMVVPVEEQVSAVDQSGGGNARPGQAVPLVEEVPVPARAEKTGAVEAAPPVVKPEVARQEGVEAAGEGRGLTEARPRSVQGGKGAPRPAIKLKKVTSRKKAGKQARAIIVTTPKEEAEIADLGTRPKKRGRPRKTPNVDPPDPHKGSVSDPGKGVCADPVNGGAILGKGGPDPHSRDRERQLAPDKGRGKT